MMKRTAVAALCAGALIAAGWAGEPARTGWAAEGQETMGAGSRAVVERRVAAGEDDPLARPKRSFVPPEGIDVPMVMADHLPAVDVMVNGTGPYRFAIDTGGAGALRIDTELVETLGMKKVGEVMGGDPSGKNLVTMAVVGVDSIQVGGATFVRIDASTRDYQQGGRMQGVDGVLGFGLFSGYTVTFDYPAGRLRLEPKELPPANGDDVLDYRDEDGVPSIELRVDSLRMAAHVDAGSMGGFVLPERLMTQLPLSGEPQVIGTARTVSNTFDIKGAPMRGTIRIGGIEFVDPRLEFQPIMPDANVGSRILRNFRVSFDTRNKRVRFARAS